MASMNPTCILGSSAAFLLSIIACKVHMHIRMITTCTIQQQNTAENYENVCMIQELVRKKTLTTSNDDSAPSASEVPMHDVA